MTKSPRPHNHAAAPTDPPRAPVHPGLRQGRLVRDHRHGVSRFQELLRLGREGHQDFQVHAVRTAVWAGNGNNKHRIQEPRPAGRPDFEGRDRRHPPVVGARIRVGPLLRAARGGDQQLRLLPVARNAPRAPKDPKKSPLVGGERAPRGCQGGELGHDGLFGRERSGFPGQRLARRNKRLQDRPVVARAMARPRTRLREGRQGRRRLRLRVLR